MCGESNVNMETLTVNVVILFFIVKDLSNLTFREGETTPKNLPRLP